MLSLTDLLLLSGPPPVPPVPVPASAAAMTFDFTIRASATSGSTPHADRLTFDFTATNTAPITPDDDWWAQLVDMHGVVLARLAKPRFSSPIVETLNDSTTATVTLSPTVDAAAWAVLRDAYPLPEVEIQIWRGERLWHFGPLTDDSFDSDSGVLVLPTTDPMWHLDRRVIGKLGAQYGGYNPELLPNDQLLNPNFADGLVAWNQLHYTAFDQFPTFSTVDTGVVSVQPDTATPPAPTPGARVIKFDAPIGNPDEGYVLYQAIQMHAGDASGIKIQASMYFYVPDGPDWAPNTQRVALQVARIPRTFSAPDSFYVDVIDQTFAVIGDAFPRGRWVLLETPPLTIPSVLFENLVVMVCAPQGTTYVCAPEGPLRASDEALEFVGYDPTGPHTDPAIGVEVNSIVALLVAISQDEVRGGAGDLNMAVDGTPYGHTLERFYPYQQHQHYGDAIRQISKDGYFDWRWRYTQTGRVLETKPKGGTYRPGARIVATVDELGTMSANVSGVKKARNWSSGATAVASQSQGKLMPHESSAKIDGVLQIQDVHVAEKNDEPAQLPLRAAEHLKTVSRPDVLTVTTEPDGVHLLTLDVGDWTDVVVDIPGAFAEGMWRVVRKETGPETRCAVLTLNPYTP